MATFDAQILQRRDTAISWQSTNPILGKGEAGYESDPGNPDKMKVGDGITAWNDLPYAYATLGSNTFTGAQNQVHGDSIASASTVNLNTATGNFIDITGAIQINAITLGDGYERTVRFNDVLTIKNSAKLMLLGDANIVTAPGDVAIFIGDAANAVQMVSYSRADGKALKETPSDTGLLGKHGRNIVAAATINLTDATGDYVWVIGKTTISSITLADGVERTVRFANPLTLTHNSAAIDLPGKADILTAAGDIAVFRGDKTGIVRIVSYQRANGTALVGSEASSSGSGSSSSANNLLWVHGTSIASAATVDLNAATGDYIYITGNITITGILLNNGAERKVRFAAALTLTHNPAAIDLPGKADILTAAGDIAVFRGDTGGRIRCNYQRANGKAILESAALPFPDSQPLLKDALDETKQVRFELGSIATETIRKIIVPDKDITLAGLDDVAAVAGASSLPVADSTAIAKGSVDDTKKVRFEVDTLVDTATTITLTVQNKDLVLAGLDDIDDAIAGITLPVADSTAIAKGSVDDTKKVRFEVDGVTAGTTRKLTVPDKDITLAGLDDITDFANTFSANTVLNPVTSPYTIPDYKNAYVVVPVGGAFTVKLNATPNDGNVSVIIAPSDADINPVTVNRNGHTINGILANYVLNSPNTAAIFVYNESATDWRRYSIASEVLGAIDTILTGFVPGAGTVTDTDSILQALQKIVGNIAAISAITASSTDTLTNKRITNRVGSTTSSATPTINTDDVDVYKLTAQAVDITSFSTNLSGTPTDTQFLEIIITGTGARAITWGASFVSSTIILPTTTVSTNTLRVTLQYDSVTAKWVCVGVA